MKGTDSEPSDGPLPRDNIAAAVAADDEEEEEAVGGGERPRPAIQPAAAGLAPARGVAPAALEAAWRGVCVCGCPRPIGAAAAAANTATALSVLHLLAAR